MFSPTASENVGDLAPIASPNNPDSPPLSLPAEPKPSACLAVDENATAPQRESPPTDHAAKDPSATNPSSSNATIGRRYVQHDTNTIGQNRVFMNEISRLKLSESLAVERADAMTIKYEEALAKIEKLDNGITTLCRCLATLCEKILASPPSLPQNMNVDDAEERLETENA
ncbi:hypothetical protein V494_06817 [Pseudogymnoascus sp. VKM F-4513 (FW-928)]|nr:hypothetical protein V494_06817 [Pseudogymnoascus sp. VKM F-4513 (FW-928)]